MIDYVTPAEKLVFIVNTVIHTATHSHRNHNSSLYGETAHNYKKMGRNRETQYTNYNTRNQQRIA